jgi:hypothetical protein
MMISIIACSTALYCNAVLPIDSSEATLPGANLAPVISEQGQKATTPNLDANVNPSGGGGVSGGTPEPGTLLLLSGGAFAYCAVRSRRRRQHNVVTEEDNG